MDDLTDDLIDEGFEIEMVPPESLRPHPGNYRFHPDDQLEHLVESLDENGFYKNVVISNDGFTLAGHGVAEAAIKKGVSLIPVRRMPYDHTDTKALKILVGDNEIPHLGEIDDRALSETLKTIKEADPDGLLGTGFDDMMLANLVFITRPAEEIKDFDEAAEWVGMPEYDEGNPKIKLVVSFDNEEDRERFGELIGVELTELTKSIHWPERMIRDVASVRFEQ